MNTEQLQALLLNVATLATGASVFITVAVQAFKGAKKDATPLQVVIAAFSIAFLVIGAIIVGLGTPFTPALLGIVVLSTILGGGTAIGIYETIKNVHNEVPGI